METARIRPRERQEGVALIMAIIFTIVVLGITFSGALVLRSHQRTTETNFVMHSQALMISKAGLSEGLAWFRRQVTQPVVDFEPQLDMAADPPLMDTIDPDIGIVREFRISGSLWGRYEVWKDWESDPDQDRLEWRRQCQCSDVSTGRRERSAGAVWSIRSLGYVYRRNDENAAYNERPNSILAQESLTVEFRRLNLLLPGQAAMSIMDGNSAHINTQGRVQGGTKGAGIFYPSGSGTPTIGPKKDNRVTGSPALASSGTFYGEIEDVFGVDRETLRAMADFVVTAESEFPSPIPENAIVFCELSQITFDASRPLTGKGIVYIDAKVDINQGSNSAFAGLLYVDGPLKVREPSELRGAVVATGNVTVQGSGDFASIVYDDDVLNDLRKEMGQYRPSRGFVRPTANER